MKINKIAKWIRRGIVSIVHDAEWRNKDCRVEWIGSPSGGAYVDLSLLNSDSIVYSFGIATEISFDRAIIKKTGCKVIGFDPDPRSEAWLNEPDRWVPPEFQFQRIALDSVSGKRAFYMTDIERMTGGFQGGASAAQIEAECLTLADIMKLHSHTWIDYLKLDVESAEYDIIQAWLEQYEQLPVGQIWIEFHPGNRRDKEPESIRLAKELERLGMVAGYRNYFRHPNNYLLINRSLLRK
jgi:FkbM family methyltransferase